MSVLPERYDTLISAIKQAQDFKLSDNESTNTKILNFLTTKAIGDPTLL